MATREELLDQPNSPEAKPLPARRMTEEEFVAWCDEDVKAEWVDGEVIVASPANTEHVDLNGWLISLLRLFVEQRDLGRVLGPESQVRFAPQRRRRVPDVIFLNHDRLDLLREDHVEGAPDLIIEIVSPDSVSRDWREKYLEYEAAGVREYWVVDPASEHMEAYALDTAGRYRQIEETQGRIASTVLPGFHIRSEWLWQEKLPKVLDVLRELGVRP